MPSDRNIAPTIKRIRITDRGALVAMTFAKSITPRLSAYVPETFGGGGAVNCEISASPRLSSISLICLTAFSKPSSPNCSCSISSNLSFISSNCRHGLLPRRKDNRVFAQRYHKDRHAPAGRHGDAYRSHRAECSYEREGRESEPLRPRLITGGAAWPGAVSGRRPSPCHAGAASSGRARAGAPAP